LPAQLAREERVTSQGGAAAHRKITSTRSSTVTHWALVGSLVPNEGRTSRPQPGDRSRGTISLLRETRGIAAGAGAAETACTRKGGHCGARTDRTIVQKLLRIGGSTAESCKRATELARSAGISGHHAEAGARGRRSHSDVIKAHVSQTETAQRDRRSGTRSGEKPRRGWPF